MIAEHCADSDCNTGDLLFKMHFVDYKLQITPKTSTKTLGIIWQWRNNIFCSKEHNYFPTWGNYKNYKRVAGLGRPTFCDKLKARTHIFHVFTFTSFHLVTIFTSKTWFHKFFFLWFLQRHFSIPTCWMDYTFSKKYPSTNKFLDVDRIDRLNKALLSNRTDMVWRPMHSQVNYWPDYYPRAVLYCAMRYVFNKIMTSVF